MSRAIGFSDADIYVTLQVAVRAMCIERLRHLVQVVSRAIDPFSDADIYVTLQVAVRAMCIEIF